VDKKSGAVVFFGGGVPSNCEIAVEKKRANGNSVVFCVRPDEKEGGRLKGPLKDKNPNESTVKVGNLLGRARRILYVRSRKA